MKFLRYLLPAVIAACGWSSQADAASSDAYGTSQQASERDFSALTEFVKTKRAMTIEEKGGNMNLSGDIRGEWYFMKSRTNGKSDLGYGTTDRWGNRKIKRYFAPRGLKNFLTTKKEKLAYRKVRNDLLAPFNTSEFGIEANVIFDYVADRGWGTIRLQMANAAGISRIDRSKNVKFQDSRQIMYGSGTTDKLALRKCFGGYNIWEQGTSRLDVEVGRRKLYDVFDSRIQFGSTFDGVLAKFSESFEGIADLYLKAAAFVVDDTVDHFGYIGELGLLNLGDSGVDLKYSLVDWDRNGKNRYKKKHPYGVRFTNSQITAAYNVSPDLVSTKTQIYGAYLKNHAAKKNHYTKNRRADDAFYVGARLGEAVRKGDWSFDFCYQWVQAQAVSERDITDAARENPRKISMYNRSSGGGANYKGWRLEGFYSMTDNWTLNAHFDRIREQNHRIGGKHRSFEFYLATIFAF